MAKEAKLEDYGPGSRRNPRDSDRRVEIHTSRIEIYVGRLSTRQFGELMRMLLDEAAGKSVEATERVVSEAWDRRDEYRRIAGSFQRSPLSLAVRRAIYERDGGKCTCCRESLSWRQYQCDHVYPVALGGSDDPGNLTAACRPCNRSKSARPLAEWRQ